MDAKTYEKAFLLLSAAMLVVFLAALFYAAFAMGHALPGRGGEIDPTEVTRTAPFDDPRLERLGPGEYRAVMTAQAWSFLPREIQVPAGSTVRFVVTSRDVIHGFHVEGTNVNAMVIPGQITRVSHTFAETGEHLIICHEYCGAGHHAMYATVRVGPPGTGAGEGKPPAAGGAVPAGDPAVPAGEGPTAEKEGAPGPGGLRVSSSEQGGSAP